MIEFDLPDELIAQEPASPRDHARLLIYDRKSKQIMDDYFYNLLKYLPDPTCVVVNNSKVEHCRMLFGDGKKEIFVLEKSNNKTVRALVRPGKAFKIGKTISLTEHVFATTKAIDSDGIRTIEFSENLDHPDLVSAEHVPLPPYIKQNDELAREYQTIYAKDLGSKAAPTAGLHFTPELLKKVKAERDWAEITLHVGLGTFAPLTAGQLASGHLHEERYEVNSEAAIKIAAAAHVTAVGTTSVRTLESAAVCHPELDSGSNKTIGSRIKSGMTLVSEGSGSTDILITPGYQFKRVDSLITNFHLPGTSLLLLVEAFVGSKTELLRIYNHAISQKYRFYSFGDCMLII
jgi:S-adenosylmethionine:tRNA ribosyltransferase-isomerase